MKKLTIILLFLSVQVFGQLTPVPDYRVQDATTAFGINVPIGAKIYNYGTGDYYVATAAIASTATITTASGSLSSLTGSAEVNDLSSVVTWTTVPDLYISQSSVTQHQAAIDHDQLLNFTTAEHFTQAAISITASQVSDFDTEVSNNTDVAANTSARHNAVTVSGTYDYITLSGQDLVRGQVDYTTDISNTPDLLTQQVDNGDKTASFTHDATSASIGNYNLSTTSAVTVSIHNLTSGKQGTIFLDIGASNPSSVTISLFSDAGSTAITAGNTRGSTSITTTANEMSTVTYTCASDGTNTEVILISSTGL